MVEDTRYINEREVSRIRGAALQTLRNERAAGKGIPFYRFGRSVRYRFDEVISWLEAHRVPPKEGAA